MSVPAEVRAAVIEILDAPDTMFVHLFATTDRPHETKSVLSATRQEATETALRSAISALSYVNKAATTDRDLALANRADAALELLGGQPDTRIINRSVERRA